jgi:hypothetical protein
MTREKDLQRQKEYRRRPEVKKRNKLWREEYRKRPEVIEKEKLWRKKYYKRPEIKKRQNLWMKEQRKRPLVNKRLRESFKRWRLKNLDYIRKYNKEYRLRPHAKKTAHDCQLMKYWQTRGLLNSIKVSMGCCDCGYNKHPAALEFDHTYGKKRRCVGQCSSPRQALAEAAKCVVRCSNCHRIKTFNERMRCGKKIRFEG